MGIPTIFDKEFLFRKSRDIDSEDFEECIAKYRKKAGENKEEQKKLDILQEKYKEESGTTASGGSSKGRNEYIESLKTEKPKEDSTQKDAKKEQTKNEQVVDELSDSQAQEIDDDYIK